MEVYRKGWDFMKSNILGIVRELQDYCFVNRRVKTSFFVLIPMKEGEKEAKDFRPIVCFTEYTKLFPKL